MIDPSPQAISESARGHVGAMLKDLGNDDMVFDQSATGKITMRRRGDDEVGLTVPPPVHEARSESEQTKYYDSEPESMF